MEHGNIENAKAGASRRIIPPIEVGTSRPQPVEAFQMISLIVKMGCTEELEKAKHDIVELHTHRFKQLLEDYLPSTPGIAELDHAMLRNIVQQPTKVRLRRDENRERADTGSRLRTMAEYLEISSGDRFQRME